MHRSNDFCDLADCLSTLADISTPALVVLGEALARNVTTMADLVAPSGKALRPHAKTHKCVEIARLQVAHGARGIACATLPELEAMAAAGLPGLLLTAPSPGEAAVRRLLALHRRRPVAIVADDPHHVALLGTLRQAEDPVLPVLVDVDVGQRRTGVADAASGVALAKAIAATPGLAFAGLQGFAGNAQHILAPAARGEAAMAADTVLRWLAAAIAAAGLPCPDISGSGTGTFAPDMAGAYTELQVGSYVFMDADYARLEEAEAEVFAPSLFVMATVVSTNRPGQVTVDAGTKALAVNGPPPHLILGAPAGTTYRFAGDEHGIIDLPEGAAPPALGSRLLIAATHCDPTVNLHPALHVWRPGEGLAQWPVVGRYGT